MNYFEALRSRVIQAPEIIEDAAGSFVIVGSHGHGLQIPQESVLRLIKSLDGVVALKMEGEDAEVGFQRFHSMSTEILAKASVDPSRLSWLAESDGEDIGQKLSKYGVVEGIMEVFVPSLNMRMHGEIPDGFFQALPMMFEHYKQRFGFLNIQHAIESFSRVAEYWREHELDPWGLDDFSHAFEGFMGDVREFEFWKPDLIRFRKDHRGKIAVVCGSYHVPFVQAILEGKGVEKPDWRTHIDKGKDWYVIQNADKIKEIYRNLGRALGCSETF